VMVRGMDNGIYHKTLDLQSGLWTGWTRIPGATPSMPSLVANGESWFELYLNVRGTDNGIYFGVILYWVGAPP